MTKVPAKRSGTALMRDAPIGQYVVAKPAVAPQRLKLGDIRAAVRQVTQDQGAAKRSK